MQETAVTVYTPESQLRSPRSLAHAMWRDLLASRELVWRLMVRDISARYRQSVLGILWAFLPPIASAAKVSSRFWKKRYTRPRECAVFNGIAWPTQRLNGQLLSADGSSTRGADENKEID